MSAHGASASFSPGVRYPMSGVTLSTFIPTTVSVGSVGIVLHSPHHKGTVVTGVVCVTVSNTLHLVRLAAPGSTPSGITFDTVLATRRAATARGIAPVVSNWDESPGCNKMVQSDQ